MNIQTKAYPRAALIGNPSDGYFGKTIAFIFKNFAAEVSLEESETLEIVAGPLDSLIFEDLRTLSAQMHNHGYYGGVRLIKAALKVFYGYCQSEGIHLRQQNFKIGYRSDIPRRLGLAGSSAIITAVMRALMIFYKVDIPQHILANLVLSTEKDELGIPAGLQDRVTQAYEGPVLMDFEQEFMAEHGFGIYEQLDPDYLPPVYIAYRKALSEGSEVFHNDLKERFEAGELPVLAAMLEWRELTSRFMTAMKGGDQPEMARLINRNFDLRREVCSISPGNIELVEAARACGASAKFSGSGGAIVGTYSGNEMLAELRRAMEKIGAEVLLPELGGKFR